MISPAFTSGVRDGTWNQCNAYCPTSYPGATMLCVNDAAENDWIRTQYGYYFWIGYTDMLPHGGGKGTKQYAGSQDALLPTPIGMLVNLTIGVTIKIM